LIFGVSCDASITDRYPACSFLLHRLFVKER
jgi:hypothetical protein